MANNGTIFLDEIGDMPMHLQSKLLRVLQERQITPIGSDRIIDIDVRVIAATHKNPLELIEVGAFRKDLFIDSMSFQLTCHLFESALMTFPFFWTPSQTISLK